MNYKWVIVVLLFSSTYYAQVKTDSLKEFTKRSTAYSVTNIQKHPLMELSGDNLGEVLQRQSANFIKTYGMGGISTLSIRGGSANQTKIYWNGIVANSPTLGQSDLSLIPTEFIEYISLSPGSAAAFEGVGGIAGSVSISSSNPFYKHKKLQFTKELGSFNAEKSHVRLELGDSVWFSTTNLLRKESQNDFTYSDYGMSGAPTVKRTNAKTSLNGVQQRFGFKHKANTFNLTASYIETDREIPVAIGVSSQDQYQLDNSLKTAFEWRMQGERAMSHLVRVGFIKDDLQFINRSSGIASVFKTQVRSLQYHNRVTFNKGWELKSQFISNQFFADSDGFDSDIIQNRISGFLNLNKEFQKWDIDIAARELLVNGNPTPFAPTFGLTYKGLKIVDANCFLNVGRNYNHPTLNDLYWNNGGNLELLPELAAQVEIGTRFRLKKALKVELTGFISKVDNWIQWTPQSNGIWQPMNVKDVLKRGGEAHLTYIPKVNHNVTPFIIVGNYQFLIAETIATYSSGDKSIGKDLIYTPRHAANIYFSYQIKGAMLTYSQSWTSKFYLDRTNTVYLPYAAPANIEISKTLLGKNEIVKFKLGVYNIFNEEFQTVANQPLPGLYFKLGFTLSFYE